MSFGGLFGGAFGIGATALSNKQASKEAKKQRQWTERMSATAYQRTMNDMRTAGLNPILAYQKGPTSIGQGAVAPVADLGSSLASGISAGSAAEERGASSGVKRQEKDLRKQQVKNAHMEEDRLLNDSILKHRQAEAAIATRGLTDAQAEATRVNTALARAQLPAAATQEAIDSSNYGKVLRWLEPGVSSAGNLLNIGKSLRGFKSPGPQRGWTETHKSDGSRTTTETWRSR